MERRAAPAVDENSKEQILPIRALVWSGMPLERG
jgi:hypothetical protein